MRVTVEPVRFDERVNLRARCRRDVGNDQILIRRQTKLTAMHFGDFSQAFQVWRVGAIGNAPSFDTQGQMHASVFALAPAEAITVVIEPKWPCRCERETHAPLD